MNNERFDQARRLVFMFKRFQAGYRYTAKEMQYEILKMNYGSYSLRTIQRDLQLLESIETSLDKKRESKEYLWYIPKDRIRSNLFLLNNELISLYLLKAHIKTFNGTFVDNELERILTSLENRIPGDIFTGKNLFWDKNIGNYDYSEHDESIKSIINFIVKDKWVTIKYDTSENGIIKDYTGKIAKIFSYSGYLYIAPYIPMYSCFIALAIHRIRGLREAIHEDIETPDFDYEEFSNIRFGVFWGEPERVEITIDKDYKKYFINRFWHSTQEFIEETNGDLKLIMVVPTTPELLSMIMSWGEGIKFIKPERLKNMLIEKHRLSLNNLMN